MGNLTKKQEAFALKYAECGNASEAYRHAYNAERMKPETINATASTLLKNHKVAVRVKELKEEFAQDEKHIAITSRENRLKMLDYVANAGINKLDFDGQERHENLAATLKAIDAVNAMMPDDDKENDAPPIQIVFNVSEPVGDVRITKGKGNDKAK